MVTAMVMAMAMAMVTATVTAMVTATVMVMVMQLATVMASVTQRPILISASLFPAYPARLVKLRSFAQLMQFNALFCALKRTSIVQTKTSAIPARRKLLICVLRSMLSFQNLNISH
jgi:hypothetical protein